MIQLTNKGQFWELELSGDGGPSQYVRGSRQSLLEVQATINTQLAADQARDPSETERRSWLRVVNSEEEANLPSRTASQPRADR